jgi:hypothetical protein
MVTLHLAYTSAINPAGATPVLTESQVWAGLQRKIRFAQEFVPVIASCDVLEEKDGVVTREVVFKPGVGPKERAKEVVRSFWPSWVCVPFHRTVHEKRFHIQRQGDRPIANGIQIG